MSDREQAQRFWDAESAERRYVTWMDDPRVRQAINARIDPASPMWPIDWLAAQLRGRRVERALSIGCGAGELERDLIRRDLCRSIDAFDGSISSVRAAIRAGIGDRVRYYVADFNRPALPHSRYDLVLFHQSLHHVGKIEKLLAAVLRALRPDGLLYLDEYVGPSSTEWTPERIAPVQRVYEAIPRAVRTRDVLDYPIQPHDPSEAIRSSEILPQLAVGFRIRARRDYGGNLLSIVYPNVRWSGAEPRLLDDLIARDQEMSRAASFYALILAEPKRGLGRAAALLRYFAAPKLARIGRELRKFTVRR